MNVAVNVAGGLGRIPALAKIALCSLAVIFTLAACVAPTPSAPDEPPAQARAVNTAAPEPAAAPTAMPADTPAPQPEAAATLAATAAPVQAPAAMAAPTAAPDPAPTAAPATSGPPSIVLNPSSAAPGITVTITGSNLPASTPVTQIRIGGRAAGPGAVTGPDGSFSAEVRVPITLSFGTHVVQVTVGDRTISVPLTVAPSAPVFGGTPVAQAFAPLGSNLRWVAFYDSEVQDWLLYDPNGTFSPDQLVTPTGSPDPNTAGSLTHMEAGQVYQVAVTNTQTVSLGGRSRSLTGGGYNFVLW